MVFIVVLLLGSFRGSIHAILLPILAQHISYILASQIFLSPSMTTSVGGFPSAPLMWHSLVLFGQINHQTDKLHRFKIVAIRHL